MKPKFGKSFNRCNVKIQSTRYTHDLYGFKVHTGFKVL